MVELVDSRRWRRDNTMVLLWLSKITLIVIHRFQITPSACFGWKSHATIQWRSDAVFFISQRGGNKSGTNWKNTTFSYWLVKSAYHHLTTFLQLNLKFISVSCLTTFMQCTVIFPTVKPYPKFPHYPHICTSSSSLFRISLNNEPPDIF